MKNPTKEIKLTRTVYVPVKEEYTLPLDYFIDRICKVEVQNRMLCLFTYTKNFAGNIIYEKSLILPIQDIENVQDLVANEEWLNTAEQEKLQAWKELIRNHLKENQERGSDE